MAITTLVLATSALGIGGYIAYAGGHVRHKEFRFELAPELRTEGHYGLPLLLDSGPTLINPSTNVQQSDILPGCGHSSG